MKDRNVQHASRFRLTKVPGTDDVYDLIPAPGEVYEEGTLINKSALLKDSTAALFGLGTDAVPDDVMAILSRLHKGLGNEYIWSKNEVSYSPKFNATYTSAPIISGNSVTSGSLTFYNSLEYVDGKYQLKDVYETFNFTISTIDDVITADVLNVGEKYFADSSGRIYKTLPGSSYGTYGGANPNFTATMENCFLYTGVATNLNFVDYVNSPDPNAYPPAVSDGYTYTYLGQIGEKVQIETGSYVGTGTYGSSNPNSLTFEFEPKLLFIFSRSLSDQSFSYTWGVPYLYARISNSIIYNESSVNGNTLTWYNTANSANNQLNTANAVYDFIVIY